MVAVPVLLKMVGACSIGSQQYSAAGSGEVDTHLSSTDSGAGRVKTPEPMLRVPLSAGHHRTAIM